ncbi:uncharacterized protein PV06_09878 [Exophiala oligosperma]|uniref:DNA endonuclease activator Ctp1 C-terminal domain-containing protein n=1 Tax=Exophiala oligosperma TaxID=215243 RepID=A0A0D2BKH2_9EURO|nr:uncharacterized protein PV06_09878 [Exophiala oligosperma]KIW37897.1 hypothetical protein PV06_09878 [Exophiala oligosperma]
MDPTPQTLTSTLILALQHSETLLRQLDESNKTIERFRLENEQIKLELDQIRSQQSSVSIDPPDQHLIEENERLKNELSDLQSKRLMAPVPSTQLDESLAQENEKLRHELEESRQKQNQLSEMTVQFEQLFRKDVEKQAEIDQLRSKLRLFQARERKWRCSNPSVSSPIILSDDADANANTTSPRTTKRKRARSRSPEVLKEITGNVTTGSSANTPTTRPKFKRHSDRGADAIPTVAEDGEDYSENLHSDGLASEKPVEGNGDDTIASKNRLKALLTTPAANSSVLLPRSDGSTSIISRKSRGTPSPITTTEYQQQQQQHQQHKLQTSTPSGEAASTSTITTTTNPSTATATATTTKPNTTNRTTSSTTSVRKPPFLPPKSSSRNVPPGPEDDEPFRSRPVARLNLTHFKINTAYTGGVDYAYDEVVRGRSARRCLPGCVRPECCGHQFRVLADTLPVTDDDLSEDDLLLAFFGPGPESEAKIRNLTAVARANLVHEARAKRLADLYGRAHRQTFDRAQSPPGFWNTEFPSTQEDRENRERARQREREEVERRYCDAKRGGGRWLFADE